ncbi:MAG: GIY-YIG nuclease family protein [Octadecabacter sp.]|nr:GIY-YIG nuclease family protein [Octadecabacter sp.]
MNEGIVYVLINEAFDGYLKIGKTINLEQRLRQLDNTSVPLPFRCVYAVKVPDMDAIEHLAHGAFADHRTRSNREFFEVDPSRVISALKMTGGVEVTPKDDIAADEEGLEALKKPAKRQVFTLYQAGLKDGDELSYSKDENIKAIVSDAKKVIFEGKEESLSSSALKLLHRDGYNWQQANGWSYWTYENETVAERLNKILNEDGG